ncbi:hypothetical protein [Mesoterricola silvestris]|uniref:Uncharacterized protein n=1 Tax=Mesoterricola silvestris TaxID=2927979 RepID=A0AA48KAB5_9BACT|nr:hypothetical protein [Mesoterricola silvestris]BDU74869.1 hypothetical protein METEAL_40430 [Mesoterricola silvestris]
MRAPNSHATPGRAEPGQPAGTYARQVLQRLLVDPAGELVPDVRTLLNLHAQLMENLLGDPMDVAPAAFTDGVLAVYELNRIDLLRDVFTFAYERSCAHYKAIRTSLGEPDPFRLVYRTSLKGVVREVILAREQGTAASDRIWAHAQAPIPEAARDRFRAAAETELANLHEGNFARDQVRPSQFEAWRAGTEP